MVYQSRSFCRIKFSFHSSDFISIGPDFIRTNHLLGKFLREMSHLSTILIGLRSLFLIQNDEEILSEFFYITKDDEKIKKKRIRFHAEIIVER